MIVLLHGLGGSAATWVHNMDALSAVYHVYAIDLPGFGLSSRPKFKTTRDSLELERRLVAGIEAWRRAMGIETFALLGHSFGGYIATGCVLQGSPQ